MSAGKQRIIDDKEARAILSAREKFRTPEGKTNVRRLAHYHNETYHRGRAMRSYEIISGFLRYADCRELTIRDFRETVRTS
ncbi:hypothetical protein J4402_03665 [Candidatus Pacearchaeota archaeon]|nr:hypothetical protein [Candidatus Pacearchaeota archaeon]